MRTQVWDNGGKTADRYDVIIGDDLWGMSEDANMPNGFCQYVGMLRDHIPPWDRGMRRITIKAMADGAKKHLASIKRGYKVGLL